MASSSDLPVARRSFVGRHIESEVFGRALDGLAAGRGGIIELVGEPGIGKTRLLIEFADDARHRGFAVLQGSATEFEHDLPFHLFIATLGERYRHWTGEGAPPGSDAEAAPWLAALFSGHGVPGSGAERFRIYAAVRDLLAGWAQRGLLVLLDDVHWADPGGIELAEYLVRHPPAAPLLLVLSFRPRQCPARLAGVLSRGVDVGTVTRLDLGPLTPAESAELAGPGLDAGAARVIWEQSGGNPLYLLSLAAARKAGTNVAAIEDVPNRLESVLLAELAPLSEHERVVAEAAAVVGEQFGIDALAPVAGLRADETQPAVSGLVRRDIFRPTANVARLAFRHPILRAVVYQNTDPGWRAAAHRRALAELTCRGAPVIERAHHVAACSGGHAPEDLRILQAAAEATMSSAPATAAHWLRIVLDALPKDSEHTGWRLQILLLLTRALGVAGRLAESRDLLHEVLRLVPRRPPGPRAAAVAFCATMERLLANYAEARALLAAELAIPRIAATREGTALAVEYGTVALLSADYSSARGHVAAAVERSRRRRDSVREANALALSAFGEVYEGDTADAAAAADAAATLVDRLSDREMSDDAECLARLGWAEMFLDRFAGAERHLTRGAAISRHTGHYHVLPHLLLGRGQLAAWRGRLSEAIRFSEEAEEIARYIGSDDVLGLALAMRSSAVTWVDEPDPDGRAVRLAEQAVRTIPESSVWWATVARTHLAIALLTNGDPQRSLQVMTEAGGGHALPFIQPSRRPSCLDVLTTAAVQTGDITTARETARRADAESRRLGLAGQRAFALRSHGLMLSVAGRHAAAVAAFSEAKDLYASVGMRVTEGMTLVLAARSAAAAGHAKTALSMANRAHALAVSMGSVKIQAMAEDARQRLVSEADLPLVHDPLAALTTREREIAQLAATGRSSRVIAAHLYLSPRTVDTHLARVYRKLGLSSRAALANLLAADHTTPGVGGG